MKLKAFVIAAVALAAVTPSFAQRGFEFKVGTRDFQISISKWDDCSRWVWNEHRHRYWDGRDWRTREEYDRLIIVQRDDHRSRDRDDDRWRDRNVHDTRDNNRDSRDNRDRSRNRDSRDSRDNRDRGNTRNDSRSRDGHEYRSRDRDDDGWRDRH